MRSGWMSVGLLGLALGCSGDGKDDGDTGHTHDEMTPFALRFAAVQDGAPVDCSTPMLGLGPDGLDTVGLSDVRFFVSDLQLLDASGAEVELTLDDNAFQYANDSGRVALIDLTGDSAGDCRASAISFSEGTARTNDVVTGTTYVDQVAAVRFSVGVPQALMQQVIGANTPEAAPSPLNELFWSWASGYRHFVFNATVTDGVDAGEGYLHIGSTDCAAEGELALESRDACGLLNTPLVALDGFDLAADTVTVDLAAALAGLPLTVPITDPDTQQVIGEAPGWACHSFAMQPDCPQIFENFGLDIDAGT
ncbi:MAG: metallo-mystery pair system four-Cys motif protein [Myxococcota bacterium]